MTDVLSLHDRTVRSEEVDEFQVYNYMILCTVHIYMAACENGQRHIQSADPGTRQAHLRPSRPFLAFGLIGVNI